MEEIALRLQELMDELGLNAANFADEIRVQRSGISHILSGRNKPSIDFLQKLAIRYPKVDLVWLITGKRQNDEIGTSTGPMQIDSGVNPGSNDQTPDNIKQLIILKSDMTFEAYNPSE